MGGSVGKRKGGEERGGERNNKKKSWVIEVERELEGKDLQGNITPPPRENWRGRTCREI